MTEGDNIDIQQRIENFHEDTHMCDEITCPYCGEVVRDSVLADDCGEIECDLCGNTFTYIREVWVQYSSYRRVGHE